MNFQEPAQEPKPESVVVLQTSSHEKEIRVALSEPKAARQRPKSDRIGDVLREARLARNDDLYLIAEYLCIKPAFLIALENSRYDEFPADAYVIGFLRTYANFLGIDGKEAVDRYRYEMAGRRKKPILSMPTPVSEGRAPSGIIMVGAAVAFILIYAIWFNLSESNRAEVHIPPPLPTVIQPVPNVPPADSTAAAGLTAPLAPPLAAAPAETTPAVPALTPAISEKPHDSPPAPVSATPEKPQEAAPAPTSSVLPPVSSGTVITAEKLPPVAPAGDERNVPDDKKPVVFGDPNETSRIVIRAMQDTWIMVVDSSGKSVFDRVLKPGESYKVPSKPGLSLTAGSGSGIVLSLDGKDLPKVGDGAPRMVRNVPLDPDRLSAELR